MEESITEMSRGTPANIKSDSSRSASKQLTHHGEMIFFVISFLGRYSFTKKPSARWRSIGWGLCFIWKIYHTSIIKVLIMRINCRIIIGSFWNLICKMVDCKCPQDGLFERQSDQQLQVIAEHFYDINLIVCNMLSLSDLWPLTCWSVFSFLPSLGSQWRCITILVGISK